MKCFTIPQTKILQIEHADELYIRSWNNSEIEIRYQGELKNDLQGDILAISCKSDLIISLPENTKIIIDKIDGNCKIYGKFENLIIGRIPGNLEINSIINGQIDKVGGNCKIGKIMSSLQIAKIGGNCYLNHIGGKIKIEKIGGNFHGFGENIQIECWAGGNIHLKIKDFSASDNQINAGGNVRLFVTNGNNISLSGVGKGGFQFQLGDELLKGKSGKFNKSIGTGQKSVAISAGGSLKISDQEEMSTANSELSDNNEIIWNDLEKKAENHSKYINKFGLSDEEGIDKKLDEIINTKEHKLSKIVENSGYSDFEFDIPFDKSEIEFGEHTNTKPVLNQKKSQPVTEEEKMIVLKMLQDKKITAEEADRLLQALEQE